jgi:hypothetical protein
MEIIKGIVNLPVPFCVVLSIMRLIFNYVELIKTILLLRFNGFFMLLLDDKAGRRLANRHGYSLLIFFNFGNISEGKLMLNSRRQFRIPNFRQAHTLRLQ